MFPHLLIHFSFFFLQMKSWIYGFTDRKGENRATWIWEQFAMTATGTISKKLINRHFKDPKPEAPNEQSNPSFVSRPPSILGLLHYDQLINNFDLSWTSQDARIGIK